MHYFLPLCTAMNFLAPVNDCVPEFHQDLSALARQIHCKAIIFDCDGTLVDSEQMHCAAWRDTFEKYQRQLTLEEYQSFTGRPCYWISLFLLEKLGESQDNVELMHEIHSYKNSCYRNLQETGISPIEGTVQLVHRLGAMKQILGIQLAVASAAPKEEILKNLSLLGILHFFDSIVSGQDDLTEYSDPEGTNKPKPYVYLHTAKQLGVSPTECVVIEDSHTGVSAGVHAGCFTIAVPNSFTVQHDLSKAHLLVPSFFHTNVEQFFRKIQEIQILNHLDEQ